MHVGIFFLGEFQVSVVELGVLLGGHGVVAVVLSGDEVLGVLLGDHGLGGFVAEVVLVFVDAGEVVVVGVVDGGAGLIVFSVVGLEFEMDAAVG